MINLLNKFNEDWINFFEVSYDGIIVADKNGRIVYMNPAAEKLEEVNKSQIIGKLASDLEKEGIYEKSVTVMVLKEKRAVSVKQCKGDKQLIITGVPLFEDNAIKWIYINERDATELNKIKQAERALRKRYPQGTKSRAFNAQMELIQKRKERVMKRFNASAHRAGLTMD